MTRMLPYPHNIALIHCSLIFDSFYKSNINIKSVLNIALLEDSSNVYCLTLKLGLLLPFTNGEIYA